MPWYTCTVNEVGPVSDSSETPDLVVYINLTDIRGHFANTWFYAANGIQNQLLDVGIIAINDRKNIEVAATAPHLPSNQPYTEISRIYGLQPQRPAAPTEFHQISLSSGVGNAGLAVLVVGWKDNSIDEDSFAVKYSGTRTGSSDTGEKVVVVGANSVTASLSLIPEYTYNIHVAAVNSAGERPSNAITVTVPPALPSPQETETVSLQRQIMDGPIILDGTFPSFGVVPPGRVLKIRFPQIGFADTFLAFAKLGHSPEEFPDLNAFVTLAEDHSTTPADMSAIFGVATPPYSTTNPINFRPALGIPLSAPLPSFVDIEITIQPD